MNHEDCLRNNSVSAEDIRFRDISGRKLSFPVEFPGWFIVFVLTCTCKEKGKVPLVQRNYIVRKILYTALVDERLNCYNETFEMIKEII